MQRKKVNMNFDASLLKKIDDQAGQSGLNRTQFITFVLINYFTETEGIRKEQN